MNEISWVNEVSEILYFFKYKFRVPLTSEDYKTKIIELDKLILETGRSYNLFYYEGIENPYAEFISDYVNYRSSNIIDNNSNMLTLFLHTKCPFFLGKNLAVDIPKVKNNKLILEPYRYSERGPFESLLQIEVSNFQIPATVLFPNSATTF